MGLHRNKALKTMGIKLSFLIIVVVLIFFLSAYSMAQDPHGPLGYYQPQSSCTQCHEALLVENHEGNCWVCHNTDYSLKLCPPATNYPPDLDFTTVCANYQTLIKEPFSCGDCHVRAGDHTTAHDQTLLPSADCSQCHVADSPVEHSKYNLSCGTCHSSLNAAVTNAIAEGKKGSPVYCADCHGAIDHQVHKNAYLPLTDCSICHLTNLGLQADIVNEHSKKNFECNACHNSTDPTVQAAISKGTAGSMVYCADCHIQFGNHARLHDQTSLTSPGCGACHVANAVAEHQGHGPHSIGCLPCHTNADAKVLTAIYNGMAGQSIPCDACHILTGNRAPIANCGPDRGAAVGVATKFSGSASYDHDGTIISYQWDFGDGTPRLSGSSVSRTFTATGTYQVSLTVTDNQGAVDNDTCVITVKTPSIKIEQVWTTDLNDVSKTIFRQGEAIRYHVEFTTEGGTLFTKAKGTVLNTSGTYWTQSLIKKGTINEGTYHWQWDKTIPLTATAGSTAKVKIVVKILDKPLGTLLGTSNKKTAFFNIQ
jgi:hypothetical protein